MKFLYIQTAIFILIFLGFQSLTAQCGITTIDPPALSDGQVGSASSTNDETFVGQSFISPANVESISQVTFRDDQVTNQNYEIRLYSGAVSSGTVLASQVITNVVGNGTEFTTILNNFNLSPSQVYTIGLWHEATVGPSNKYRINLSSDSTNPYADGNAFYSGTGEVIGTDLDFTLSFGALSPVPTSIAATNVSKTTVTINWNAVTPVDQYVWEIFADGSDPSIDSPLFTGNTAATNQAVSGLTAGTSYDMYVRAACDFTNSPNSLSGRSNRIDFTTLLNDYTYQSDALGWIDDPSGDMDNPASILTDNITILDGNVAFNTNVFANNVTVSSTSVLTLNADLQVSAELSLSGVILGNGFLIMNNPTNGAVSSILTDNEKTIKNLRIADNDGTRIGSISNSNVNITGTLDLSAGDLLSYPSNKPEKLVFISNATGTGQVVGTGGIVTSGAVTEIEVQRFISGKRAYRFLSSPVSGQSIFNSWQEGGLEPLGFGTHITGIQSMNIMGNTATDAGETGANGFDITASGNASMYTFGSNWSAIASTDALFHSIGTPYRIMIRGDRTIDLNVNTSGAGVETTLRASGSLEQTSISIPVQSGFSFVGNPYQSYVDLTSVAYPGADDFIYYWDPNLGTNGAYTAVDISDNTATGGSSASRILQPGQAFFINASTAGTMDFNLTDKVLNPSQPLIFSMPTDDKSIVVNLYTEDRFHLSAQAQDGVVLKFNIGGNDAIDRRDALKLNNIEENISIISHTGQKLAVSSQSFPQAQDTIDLGITDYNSSNYVIQLFSEDLPGLTTFLKDTYLNSLTELNSGTVNYYFQIDQNDPLSSSESRFKLVFEATLLNNELISNNQRVTVYPNPVTEDHITIDLENASTENISFKIFNTLGQEIRSTVNSISNDHLLEIKGLSSLQKGVYLIQINQGRNNWNTKIVLK